MIGAITAGIATEHNETKSYFDGSQGDEFCDKVTYSTNTLESAVTVTWPSEGN